MQPNQEKETSMIDQERILTKIAHQRKNILSSSLIMNLGGRSRKTTVMQVLNGQHRKFWKILDCAIETISLHPVVNVEI